MEVNGDIIPNWKAIGIKVLENSVLKLYTKANYYKSSAVNSL